MYLSMSHRVTLNLGYPLRPSLVLLGLFLLVPGCSGVSSKPVVITVSAEADALVKEGDRQADDGMYLAAIDTYTKASQAVPGWSTPVLRLAAVYTRLHRHSEAGLAMRQGAALLDAEEQTRAPELVAREYAVSFFRLGQALERINMLDDAREAYELQADLDAWLEQYNTARPHHGYRTQGRTPLLAFSDGLTVAREEVPPAA